ncbi:MAG: hypothetical protein CL920_31920 [Deltaproteobacteria bacterium]|nr:hypothetical protein [Deltaproteobacteria bacterium]MBU53328.1 hypothetical protein [Deltaproteobacteria bacterium]
MLQIQLFGGLHIVENGIGISPIKSFQLQKILAYLTLQRQQVMVRRHVASQLWPDYDEQRATGNLRNILYRLKKSLSSLTDILQIDKFHIQWDPNFPVEIDTEQFQHLLQQAAAPTQQAEEKVALLEQALQLYKGPLLPWCYDDWLLAYREQYAEQYVNALRLLVKTTTQLKDYRKAIHYGNRLLQEDPYNEALLLQLMRNYMKSGDRVGAIRCFEQSRQQLKSDIGADFSLMDLLVYYGKLREMDDDEVDRTPTPFPQFFDQPADIHQQIEHIATKEPIAFSLPTYLTPFVGRDALLDDLAHKLTHSTCRLLNLTGLGGIGKTRLAVEAARHLYHDFESGCQFFSLEEISTIPSLVTQMLRRLKLPHTQPTRTSMLLQHIGQVEALLIIDDANSDAEELFVLIEQLLQHGPRIKIIVTSRLPLPIKGRWNYEVPGLAVPQNNDFEVNRSNEAVELFVECASRINANFTPSRSHIEQIIKICQLVDGMPLGIELATIWMRSLTPAELKTELEQDISILMDPYNIHPPKHQDIMKLLGGSLSSLSEPEKKMLRRISIFPGNFTKEAAKEIAAFSLPLLQKMVDYSILKRSPRGRYSLHPLLRQYLQKCHETQPEERHATRMQFCKYYSQTLYNLGQMLWGESFQDAIQLINEELDNIHLAATWACELLHQDLLEELLHTLDLFYRGSRRFQEGHELFQSCRLALHAHPSGLDPIIEHRFLARQAFMDCFLRNYTSATEAFQQTLDFFTTSASAKDICYSLNGLGHTAAYIGELKQAQDYLQRALAVTEDHAHDLNFAPLRYDTLYRLSYVLVRQGQLDESRVVCEEGLEVARQLGNPDRIAAFLQNYGTLELLSGNYIDAVRYFHEAEEYYQMLGDEWQLAICYINLGDAFNKQGKFREADSWFSQAQNLCKRLNYEWGLLNVLIDRSYARIRQGKVQQTRKELVEALAYCLRLKSNPLMIDTLVCIAHVLHTEQLTKESRKILVILNNQRLPRPDMRDLLEDLKQSLEFPQFKAIPMQSDQDKLVAFSRSLLAQLKARWGVTKLPKITTHSSIPTIKAIRTRSFR